MNVLLDKLFLQYEISEKTQHEVKQLYGILSHDKKQLLLHNFETLAQKLHKIEEDTIIEQGLLINAILPDIEEIVQKGK